MPRLDREFLLVLGICALLLIAALLAVPSDPAVRADHATAERIGAALDKEGKPNLIGHPKTREAIRAGIGAVRNGPILAE